MQDEHVDVLIVGAGLSGIGAGYHLQQKCPGKSYAILEGRETIGGTWDLFRYPGVRSDSDMFTLGYSFRPWQSAQVIAGGDAILTYITDTAAETGVDGRIRLNHRVVRASWSTGEARWHIVARRTDTGETVEITCGFVFSCTGYYRYDRGYLPDFAGMDRFGGMIVHPQSWPSDLDYAGQRVIVIGSGATAVTLAPALAETARHVTMVQRSPTYIAPLPARDPIAEAVGRILPPRQAGPAMRWFKALTTEWFFQLSQHRPELVKRMVRRQISRQLPAGYDVDTHFTPRYNPWDQRFCIAPDGDLFTAIRNGSVSVVTDYIDTFTERGLLLKSGTELDADIIVTATGLELLFIGGIELRGDGDAPVHPRQQRRFGQRPAAAGPHLGIRAAGGPAVPEAGLPVPVAGASELPARLPGAAAPRDQRRCHGVLQPGLNGAATGAPASAGGPSLPGSIATRPCHSCLRERCGAPRPGG